MGRWPTEVDNAIREAVAAGIRWSDALRKLQAGTLYGAEATAISESTFSKKWRKARQELQRNGAGPCPTCGALRGDSAAPQGGSILEAIGRSVIEEEEAA